MSLKEFYTLTDVDEALNNGSNVLLQFDDDECNAMDVVELPPDNMDIMSDEEDIDEGLLGESVLTYIPGRLHTHSSIQRDISNEQVQPEPSSKMQKICPKMQRTKSL